MTTEILDRSRTQTNLQVEEDSDPSMDEFVPYEIPMERDMERDRSPKNKQVAIDGMELPAEEWYCECFNSQASGSGTDQVHPPTFNAPGFDAFFDSIGANFDTLLTDREHAGLDQFLRALRMCNGVSSHT